MTSQNTKIIRELASLLEVDREDMFFNKFGELEFKNVFNLCCGDFILIANVLGCQTRHLWISPKERGFTVKVKR